MAWAPIFNQHPRDTYNEFRRLAAFLQTTGVSPLTTKGDLYTFGTGNDRLAVGTNGHVLTADSTQPKGIKWAASASGGPRCATKVVAAVDSISTAGADYVCDGTADQTEINSAITAADANGRVLLLEGTYTLSGAITANEIGGVLEGQGWGTKIIGSGGSEAISVSQARYRVANLTVDTNNVQVTGVHSTASYTVVEGCRFINLTGNGLGTIGVWVSGVGNSRAAIRNNVFLGDGSDIERGVFIQDGGSFHMVHNNYFEDLIVAVWLACNHSLVADNQMNVMSTALYLDDGDFNAIVGNDIKGATSDGILIDASCDRTLVDGNQLYDGNANVITDNGTNTLYGTNVDA